MASGKSYESEKQNFGWKKIAKISSQVTTRSLTVNLHFILLVSKHCLTCIITKEPSS
jgi:hypothetical protein